jgi:hypothetical protein
VIDRVYGSDGELIGAVEYEAQRDRFVATTLPIREREIFYDYDMAVRWVRDQYVTGAGAEA